MKRMTEHAARTREILRREQTPVSRECEQVILADLKRLLSGYFSLEGEVRIRIEKGSEYHITIEADASLIKPFGVIRC